MREIVEFLELENVDIDRVVSGSRFNSKDEHFKTKDDIEHKEVKKEYSHLVKRKGKVDSWKSELTEESLKYYRQYFE